jgi:hypothetical protein
MTNQYIRIVIVWCILGVAVACSDLTGNQELPSGVRDPQAFRSADGAIALYNEAISSFEEIVKTSSDGSPQLVAATGAFKEAVLTIGLFTDELHPTSLGGPSSWYLTFPNLQRNLALDARQLPESDEYQENIQAREVYIRLQTVRASTNLAIGALKTYAPNSSPALRGHMYALQGYAELLLADLYCSGVPLSTLDFEKDYTYQSGSPSAQVYMHAAALFDTAIVLADSADSSRIANLARVGLGRARLSLGQFTEAAQAVEPVEQMFSYQFPVTWKDIFDGFSPVTGVNVSDREGSNGLPYITWNDPRTETITIGTTVHGKPLRFPAKYGTPQGFAPLTVASGIEAQLIRAEWMLREGNTTGWLTILNHLREAANDPRIPPTLEDPGDSIGRIDLFFQERAAWLFLSGQRQNDLRRLIRQYGRDQRAVYPNGQYPNVWGHYGSAVNLPIPSDERLNPKFQGCIDRKA